MDELGHSCAFTGHRPYKLPWKDNESDPRCIMLMRRLYDQIAALAGRGVTDYYSGMAEGKIGRASCRERVYPLV